MKTNGNFTTAACATEIEVIKMGLLKEEYYENIYTSNSQQKEARSGVNLSFTLPSSRSCS